LIDLLVNAPDACGAASGATAAAACLDDTPLVIILLLSSYFSVINTIVNFKKLQVK